MRFGPNCLSPTKPMSGSPTRAGPSWSMSEGPGAMMVKLPHQTTSQTTHAYSRWVRYRRTGEKKRAVSGNRPGSNDTGRRVGRRKEDEWGRAWARARQCWEHTISIPCTAVGTYRSLGVTRCWYLPTVNEERWKVHTANC